MTANCICIYVHIGSGDYEISAATNYGIVDLFVTGDGSLPTTSHYQWGTPNSAVLDVITIRSGDMSPGTVTYNIMVHALFDSEFSVLVFDAAEVLSLSGGVPVRATVFAHTYEYFSYTVSNIHKTTYTLCNTLFMIIPLGTSK